MFFSFIVSLNVWYVTTENQSFTFLQVVAAFFKYLAMLQRFSYVDASKSIF